MILKQKSSYRRWILRFLAATALLLLVLAAFNWAIDPMWCFGHQRWFTKLQKPFDERQQKTNYLTFVNRHQYDAIILGNSRTSLIDQNEFRGLHPYNYSMPGMSSYEFKPYLDYFRRTNGAPKVILLGIDFDHTNLNLKFAAQPPEYYINAAHSWLYRYRTLFTYDTAQFSKENLTIDKFVKRNKFGGGAIIYNNCNVARLLKPNDEARRREHIQNEVARLRKTYKEDYKYREDLVQALREIKESSPGARVIPFSTPVSKVYFCAMVQEGKLPEFKRFIREVVGVYGELWNFQNLNSVTSNPNNYSDSHHYYSPIGTLVAHKISGVADPAVPADFGTLVNQGNLEQHLAGIEAQATNFCK